jgi:hypothetical protein
MWSGPRNISTAMMRSWGNRPDTFVWDEPFYAHYLTQYEIDHPGTDEVVAAHETDWRKVVARLTGPIPEGRTVFYQKQMAHHLLPHIDRGWLGQVRNCFLLRDPKEMLASLGEKMSAPTLRDTGLAQQVEIFRWVRQTTGKTPPVLDAADVLRDPRRILGALCEALGVPFTETMLSWPPGRRSTDGVWAKHWYAAVEKSTGFEPYRPKDVTLRGNLLALLEECRPYYAELHEARIQ